MGLNKRLYIEQETLITAENLNSIQDAIIALEAGLFSVDNGKGGEVISITDAYKRGFRSFSIYGKTTQDGIPTLDAPVDLVNAGDSGSITVSVTNENEHQSMTVATPNGLPGIPVASGGNYTDASGQQWICDEIDFARGVYIKRINKKVYTGAEPFTLLSSGIIYYVFASAETGLDGRLYPSLCSHLPYNSKEDLVGQIGQRFRFGANNQNRLYFAHPSFTTVEEFVSIVKKANNANAPLSVYYALNTPIETPLTEEEIAAYSALHTYKNSTTVSNDAGAWMELEYVMDSKKYIDSMISSAILEATVE